MGASISVAPALFLLIIAAIAALFYYIYYKNKINRALENGEDAESAGLEPASFTKTALIAVLMIILIIMLFRISSLRSQLTDMENKLNNVQQQVYAEQNILNDISKKLDQQASIIEDYSVSYGKFDAKTHSAEILFTVTPKQASEDSMLTVTAGKQMVILQKSALGSYTGKLRMDIFAETDETSEPRLTITTNGESRHEVFGNNELSELWLRYLPTIASQGFGTKYDGNTLSVSGDLHLEIFSKNEMSEFIKDSFRLRTEVNHYITEETDISADVTWNDGRGVYQKPFEYSTSLGKNETFRLTVTAKDTNGYTHEYTVLSHMDDGQKTDIKTHDMRILDAEGNQIN